LPVNFIYPDYIAVFMEKSPGRPDLGKSKTIKERTVYIYLPTKDMLDGWKKEAKRHGLSLSRFVQEVVDDVLRRSPDGITPREEIKTKLDKASNELASLRAEKEELRSQLSRTERLVASYRESLYVLVEVPQKDAVLSGLIGLFVRRRVWRLDDVPAALGINLADEEAMRRLRTDIDYLKMLGLIKGDFEELRCRIGARKKRKKSPEAERKRAARSARRLSRRLQTSRHDSDDSGVIRLGPS
jgi:hypothetical protein